LTINSTKTAEAVIQSFINGLPRSEISANTGISEGAVSNIIKNWKESGEEIQDIEDIRGFMKQVYKTGATVKECAQGFRMVQMMRCFYNNKNQDVEVPTIFWAFINDILRPCIKLGIPPSLIPAWIKDLTDFLLHPNRHGDVCFYSNRQNISNKHPINKISTGPNSTKTKACKLDPPNSIEKLEIAEISDAKKQISGQENNLRGLVYNKKYLIENPNFSFISKLSSHINTKKKKCMEFEERIKGQQNKLEQLNLQIDRSQALRNYVIDEEQSIMEVYNWYHELKNALMNDYNIPIEDVHKFARVIHEFSKSGYDAIYILKDFLKIGYMKFEIQVIGTEIKQLNDEKTATKSTLKFEESRIEECRQTMDTYYQLEKMNFGLDKLRQIKDIFVETSRVEKKPINEVSREFFADIQQNYYDSVRFESKVIEERKKLAEVKKKLDESTNSLAMQPYLYAALTNLLQKGVSEKDILDTYKIIKSFADGLTKSNNTLEYSIYNENDYSGIEVRNQDLQTNWHLIIEKIRTYKNILSDIRLEIIKYKQVKKEGTVPYLQKQNLYKELNRGLYYLCSSGSSKNLCYSVL